MGRESECGAGLVLPLVDGGTDARGPERQGLNVDACVLLSQELVIGLGHARFLGVDPSQPAIKRRWGRVVSGERPRRGLGRPSEGGGKSRVDRAGLWLDEHEETGYTGRARVRYGWGEARRWA